MHGRYLKRACTSLTSLTSHVGHVHPRVPLHKLPLTPEMICVYFYLNYFGFLKHCVWRLKKIKNIRPNNRPEVLVCSASY